MARWRKESRAASVRHRFVALGTLALTLILALAACSPSASTVATATATPLSPADLTKLCPAFTAPAQAPTIPGPSDTSAQAIARYNAARVLQTPRPIRNLYSLTQRLVARSDAPIPCVTRTTPRNDQVGHSETFWVTNSTQTGYRQVQATLAYTTPHLYMYVARGASLNTDALTAAANRFEQRAYPTDRRTYGAQWSPGPDDDPHITVLHVTGLGNIGGYFSSSDEYPKAVSRYSNERQMIYVNLDSEVPGEDYYDATLAHEFQHMIHWYSHPADPAWTNEGMSVLAQHINGYTSGDVEQVFLRQPDTMLGGWSDDPEANRAHYGAGYLFMDYFAEHYGGYSALQELLSDPEQVPLNFDHVLAARGYTERFDDVFANFAIANLLNAKSPGGGLYAYPTIGGVLATPQHRVSSYPYSDAGGSVHQYATQYYDLRPAGSGTLSVDFKGSPYVGIVDNSPANGASAEWWSNSANYADTTLTRSVDLGSLAGKGATLRFQAWYSLEPDFDYAYVEASTDSGKTWHTVKTSVSSATNPNGANYGDGITGISGGAASDNRCGPRPEWTPVTADLSAYAGKQIQLRFEAISDDSVHCPGLALDDIRIPELGFADNVASDNGWQAQGFIRSNNVLPETYIVQAVMYSASGGVTVRRIPVDAASGTGQASIAGFGPGGSGISRVVLAVSAVAPATIIPAQYALSAQVA